MYEIELLRKRIRALESENRFDGNKPYPTDLTKVPGVLLGQGFFPGGDGLWRDRPESRDHDNFPSGGIMILGNDFGCLDNPDPKSPGFRQCLANGSFENPPTWNIKETLRRAGLPGNGCFFTNAYLGLRRGTNSKGKSPGLKDPDFRPMCAEFLEYQLGIQRPILIVCLGHEPRRLLASILLAEKHAWRKSMPFSKLDNQSTQDQHSPQIVRGVMETEGESVSPFIVTVAHPSFAWSAHVQWPRYFEGKSGEAAEDALLAGAWRLALASKQGAPA
jgi:hypothetical protein